MAIPPAPSAPPTSVRASALNSTVIRVQWGPVPCIDQNGDITGYSVQYGEVGSGSTQTMPVSGGSVTEATIFGLMQSTTYSIQVAEDLPSSAVVLELTLSERDREEHVYIYLYYNMPQFHLQTSLE